MTNREQLKSAVAMLELSLEATPGLFTEEELKQVRVQRAQAVVQASRALLAELQGRPMVTYRGGGDTP